MSYFSMFYQNIGGLKTKLKSIFSSSLGLNYDAIFLTETWLDKSILDNEILCSSYQTFRVDRSHLTSSKKSGGGVLIAIKNCYNSKIIALPSTCVEMVCVTTLLNGFHLFTVCIYIPPKMSSELYDQCTVNIKYIVSVMKPNDRLVLIGDFNLPDIEWEVLEEDDKFLSATSVTSEESTSFVDSTSSLALNQINPFKNEVGNFLDLVFTDDVNGLTVQRSCPLLGDVRFHPCFEVLLEIPSNACASQYTHGYEFDFKKTDFVKLNMELSQFQWDLVFHDMDVNKATDTFYDILHNCFSITVPVRRIKIVDNCVPWLTPFLKRLKNKKK